MSLISSEGENIQKRGEKDSNPGNTQDNNIAQNIRLEVA